MTMQIAYEGTLTTTTCWCGMKHAVPTELYEYQLRAHRDDGKSVDIYCPLGHAHVPAGKSEADKLRERLAAEQRRVTSMQAVLDQERASLRATKGQLTKARNRAAKGVCPVPGCKRSFSNVARHVANQHPDFHAEG